MTLNRLPGITFKENVTVGSYDDPDYVPLFVVQTSTALPDADGVITEYNTFAAFKKIAENKGLNKTLKYMEDILSEAETNRFYVYSIKTDTKEGFTEAIKSTAHLDDVKNIIYIEENKSTSQNTIQYKIQAISSGMNNNSENGAFREAYIIPYGTIQDAITNSENTTPDAAVIASLTTICSGTGTGRICIIVPDSLAGSATGKCISVNYDEEPGYTPLNNIDLSEVYSFDYTQMVTLQNLGVIFVNSEKIHGETQYRINLGVTTSFKENAADGLIVSRTIADEILRQIGYIAQAFIKAKESTTNLAQLKTEVAGVISDFKKEQNIVTKGTKISVADAGRGVFVISGTIQPAQSVVAIEVNTTLS